MGNSIRIFLWVNFLVLLWFTYSSWIQDYSYTENESVPSFTQESPTLQEEAPPSLEANFGEVIPSLAAPSGDIFSNDYIEIKTDVLDLLIDLNGGDLVRSDLLFYPVNKDDPDNLIRLLDPSPENRWVYQTGFRGIDQNIPEPNHLSSYTSSNTTYELLPGEDELVVTLFWQNLDSDLRAYKTYTFNRGQYSFDLALHIENTSNQVWLGAPYAQQYRKHVPVSRSYTSVDSYSFKGPVFYDGDSYDKVNPEDFIDQPFREQITGGWLANIQHHFVAAIVPPDTDQVSYQGIMRDDNYLLTSISPLQEVSPGEELSYNYKFFVGPKLQAQLAEAGDSLELTVDYGMLTFLAQPLFWLLAKIHSYVNNWGWSIVILTMLIKLVFYKLTAASGRSMAKMRKIQPKMKAIQEKHKDDRQALSQAMMDIYKKEKINPVAGCLPILIQMPFFFAFYWVLIESVEIRQASIMLWITDLSVKDPFFILPIFMGIAMLLQTRLNPAPPDPIQARVMQIMPIAFTGLFAFFPSGLVLYWLTNTVLSILQQWRINKVIAAE